VQARASTKREERSGNVEEKLKESWMELIPKRRRYFRISPTLLISFQKRRVENSVRFFLLFFYFLSAAKVLLPFSVSNGMELSRVVS